MSHNDKDDRKFRYQSDLSHAQSETLAVRAGQRRTFETEHSEPIFTTSSYVFNSAKDAADRFSGTVEGNIYSRYTNPTVRTLEERIAAMEGAEQGVGTASGMAAISSVCLSLLETGEHIVSSRSIFGTTNVFFEKYLKRLGIQTSYVALTDIQAWEAAIQPGKTKLLFLETPSNPLSEIADIQAVADIAHRHECLLVVDNCFCTPALQKPLALGADIVIHSATKYIDGQGRCIGGLVVGSQELMQEVVGFIRSGGPSMSPFNAWVFLKGLETLNLRMKAHSESALKLAQWLSEHPKVQKVYYAGLPSHPQHELAKLQQTDFGGVLSFELMTGGVEQAWACIDATRMISITANLGDSKTTITHPATTTHGRLSPEGRAAAGISDGLIRVAVGLENVDDIKADLALGLSAVD